MPPSFSRRPVFAEDRGRLTLIDFDALPFVPTRSYTLSAIPAGARRGGHGWRSQHRFLVIVAGEVSVTVDPLEPRVLGPGDSVHVPPGHWHELVAESDDLVVLVFADGVHDPQDGFTERR